MSAIRGTKSKAVLDREGFQQLLAAAYVLQQHNDSLRAEDPRFHATPLSSEIAEMQALVARRDLDLRSASALIAERLRKMAGATGVSICVVEAGCLDPIAQAGIAARVPGGAV